MTLIMLTGQLKLTVTGDHLSVVVRKHHGQGNPWKKEFIWVQGYKGLESMVADTAGYQGQAWQLEQKADSSLSSIASTQQREEN